MSHRYEKSGMTGGIVERELFGKSEYEAKYPHEVKEKLGERFKEYKHYDRWACIKLLKTLQPFNPLDPKPDFANDVRTQIARDLSIGDADILHFYTAVKSPFDLYFGVDGWFEITTPEKIIIVTVDLTTNPQKDEKDADIVFRVPIEGLSKRTSSEIDKEQYLMYYSDLAKQVRDKFVYRSAYLKKLYEDVLANQPIAPVEVKEPPRKVFKVLPKSK